MPKQRRYGYTLIELLGIIATIAVLASILLTRLNPVPLAPWYDQGQFAWLAQPIHLPPKAHGLMTAHTRILTANHGARAVAPVV